LARLDNTTVTSTHDLEAWVGGLAPGLIIKNFVCDIDPIGLSNRRRRRCGHRAAVSIKSLDAIRSHLQVVKESKPKDYQVKGYLPRGSISTNGFRVNILAFKLRERQDARYKRLPQEDLPNRLTSTVAGTDYYLTEIRNAIKTKEDIEKLWPGKDVKRMKILCLDGGQACVFGAFAHLPMGHESSTMDKGKDSAGEGRGSAGEGRDSADEGQDRSGEGQGMEGVLVTSRKAIVDASHQSQVCEHSPIPTPLQSAIQPAEASEPAFLNLVVKAKAVYQPTLRFRRWQESEKTIVPDNEEESVHDIESRLPPLRGSASSVVDYTRELLQVEDRLKAFYAGDDHRFQRRQWDHARARQIEYQAMAERLLGIVGGSLGRRLEDNQDDDPILIGIGLGQFMSNGRLTSLHSSFLEYFIKAARSLGYFHRDTMAAENMYLVVRERLDNFQRPKHLQPIRADGSYPWQDNPLIETAQSSTSAPTSVSTPRRRKRTSVTYQSKPSKATRLTPSNLQGGLAPQLGHLQKKLRYNIRDGISIYQHETDTDTIAHLIQRGEQDIAMVQAWKTVDPRWLERIFKKPTPKKK
ncbi:hypothetical protein EC991_003368, partial [Linnemannia zychae]